jgi:hypothetical protein
MFALGALHAGLRQLESVQRRNAAHRSQARSRHPALCRRQRRADRPGDAFKQVTSNLATIDAIAVKPAWEDVRPWYLQAVDDDPLLDADAKALRHDVADRLDRILKAEIERPFKSGPSLPRPSPSYSSWSAWARINATADRQQPGPDARPTNSRESFGPPRWHLRRCFAVRSVDQQSRTSGQELQQQNAAQRPTAAHQASVGCRRSAGAASIPEPEPAASPEVHDQSKKDQPRVAQSLNEDAAVPVGVHDRRLKRQSAKQSRPGEGHARCKRNALECR